MNPGNDFRRIDDRFPVAFASRQVDDAAITDTYVRETPDAGARICGRS